MKLYEFFGSQKIEIDPEQNTVKSDGRLSKEEEEKLSDELYWFILDDDDIHKKFFLPLAKEIKQAQDSNKFNHEEFIEKFMPMVKSACITFYRTHGLKGHPKHIFSKTFRLGLCKRLASQHFDDISRGEYSLGE